MNLSVKHYDQGGECWVDHVGSDVSVKIKICCLITVVGIQVLIEFGESSRNPYMVLSPCGAVHIYRAEASQIKVIEKLSKNRLP